MNKKGKVTAICISEKKGTKKEYRESGEFIENFGLKGDAHAGNWHRQISLLSADKVHDFNEKGGNVSVGDFGENVEAEGIDFRELPVGTLLKTKNVELKITQIGKECHSHCEIYHRVGVCIMPIEGVFAKVLKGGIMKVGEEMEVELPRMGEYTAAVIVLSDSGSRGEREDKSGPEAEACLSSHGYEVLERIMIPDDEERLKKELIRLCDSRQVNAVFTSGGTGFSVRDTTPEATMAVAERNAPGIAEAIRIASLKITGRAMLSRGVSVIRGSSIIVNLPGSPKAVRESLDVIMDDLKHGIDILRGSAINCGD